MPKLIVSIDGVVVKEVQLTKDRSTIGRRPYNDVVIDNLAVSGEHAVIRMAGGSAVLEDLGSTNGTYVDGTRIALLSDSFLCALRDLRDIEGDDLVARITAALADAIATYTSCSWPAAATHARRVLPSIKTSLISRVEYRQRTRK